MMRQWLVILLDYYNPCDKHQRRDISSYYEDFTYRSLDECIDLDTICAWISTLLAKVAKDFIVGKNLCVESFTSAFPCGCRYRTHKLQNNNYAELLIFKIRDIKQGLQGYINWNCHEMTCFILTNVLYELNVV